MGWFWAVRFLKVLVMEWYWPRLYLGGVSSPRDESLLFRQKEPKPFLPVRGPSEPAQKQALRDASASAPNQDGSGTRSAQTAFAEKSIRCSGSTVHEGRREGT